jgi:sucrose-6-phosphate hydrolase SacC (GH32 family)
LEVFSEDGLVSMTSCFLPDPGAPEMTLFATQGSAFFNNLTIFELNSAWNSK